MKVSSFAISAFALMLILAGFVAGWSLGYQQPPFSSGGEAGMGVQRQAAAASPSPTMPSEDVTGDDVSGLPRYPGAVRIEHVREDLGGLMATEVEYLTPTGIDTVREFYRDTFRTEDWDVADVSFSEGAWNFFVTRDEREVFVEIKPYGSLTEVDFELTEPKPGQDPPKEPQEKEPRNEEPPAEEEAVPEPGPQPSAPTWSPPPASSSASPSAPAYDDDDGLEEFDDDDGFEGED